MGRGQIGDSKSDKAYARMEKAMAKSDREKERAGIDPKAPKPKVNHILEQLKAFYPETWQEELKKLQNDYAAKMAVGDTDIRIKSADDYKRV